MCSSAPNVKNAYGLEEQPRGRNYSKASVKSKRSLPKVYHALNHFRTNTRLSARLPAHTRARTRDDTKQKAKIKQEVCLRRQKEKKRNTQGHLTTFPTLRPRR